MTCDNETVAFLVAFFPINDDNMDPLPDNNRHTIYIHVF